MSFDVLFIASLIGSHLTLSLCFCFFFCGGNWSTQTARREDLAMRDWRVPHLSNDNALIGTVAISSDLSASFDADEFRSFRFIPYKDGILPLRSHLDLSPHRSKQSNQIPPFSPKYVDVLHSQLLGYSPKSSRVLSFRPPQSLPSPSRFSPNSSLLNVDTQNIMLKKCTPRKFPHRPLDTYNISGLKDDFYLNLLGNLQDEISMENECITFSIQDWSSTNLIAVGIRNCPQIINRTNGKLFTLPAVPRALTCVHWLPHVSDFVSLHLSLLT